MLVIMSILSAILYRMGGKGGKWYLNTKVRDLGVPACAVAYMALTYQFDWWVHFLSFGLMFGGLTKYWGKPKDKPAIWWHWALTGAVYGFCGILYAWQMGGWEKFIYRIIVLSIFTAIWSEAIDNDTAEEAGRGFLYVVTMGIL